MTIVADRASSSEPASGVASSSAMTARIPPPASSGSRLVSRVPSRATIVTPFSTRYPATMNGPAATSRNTASSTSRPAGSGDRASHSAVPRASSASVRPSRTALAKLRRSRSTARANRMRTTAAALNANTSPDPLSGRRVRHGGRPHCRCCCHCACCHSADAVTGRATATSAQGPDLAAVRVPRVVHPGNYDNSRSATCRRPRTSPRPTMTLKDSGRRKPGVS